MTFGSPWLLWGTLLGAIPIIVHLLNRRRYRETSWAAMRFLLEATRKNSRRIRLEQLILLAVRTLILVLLALALARPFVESTGLLGTTTVGVHRIIVIDATYSMSAAAGRGSRFEAALAAAREVVRGSRQGDALNLVVMHRYGPRTIVGEPSFRHEEVLDELELLEVSHTPGDLPGVLHEVAALLERSPAPDRKEVVFIGDLQRIDWSPRREAGRSLLREAVESLGDVPIAIVDVGENPPANVAVTGLELDESIVSVDRPATFRVTLRNHDADVRGTHPVELHVDGRLRERKSIALPASGEGTVDFAVAFDMPGEHVVEARSPADGLPLDDARQLVVEVREVIDLLLVDGSPSGRFGESATSFLEVALVPDEETPGGLLRRRTIGEGELLDVDLARFDAVFVCNLGLLTDREADVLRRYVESGGGLVVVCGERLRVDNYNRTLYRTEFSFADVGLEPDDGGDEGVRVAEVEPGSPAHLAGIRSGWTIRSVDGTNVDDSDDLRRTIERGSLSEGITIEATSDAGRSRTVRIVRPTLLPARLREIVRTGPDGDGFGFDAADLSHPIVQAFEGNPEAGLLSTRVLHYAGIDQSTLGTARVVLPFTTGEPAILEHQLGRGHVVLVTTSLDRTWGGTWPGRPSFPQLVRELTSFVVRGRSAGRSLVVGESILRTFATPVVGVSATITRPDGRTETVPMAGAGTTLSYDRTDRAGTYEWRLPAPVNRREQVAVNLDPVEGELGRVDPGVLDNVLAGVSYRVLSEWTPTITDESQPGGGSVAIWLLTAVAALLLVETVMAWRFALGFALLCGLVGATLLGRIAPWWVVALSLLVAVAAFGVWYRRRPAV